MKNHTSSFLPYGRQHIDEDDIQAVTNVLRSDFLTCGPAVREFEVAFAETVGAPHAVVCSNGTAALHLASLALGLGPEHQVIVPTVTFLATASAPHFTGADIIFADVSPTTGLMTEETFEDALSRSTRNVAAVFPVHLNGACVDLKAIALIAKARGMAVIDDACHALGASMNSEKIGSGSNSDMTVFSMHPVKSIAMGEGGVVTTANASIARSLEAFRNHGIVRTQGELVQTNEAFDKDSVPNPWYYEMQHPGLNYRASDIHCALGLSQLKKLDRFIAKRRLIADAYDKLFAEFSPMITPTPRVTGCEGGWHLYPVLIDFDTARKSRAEVMKKLQTLSIGTQVHYLPVHRQPYWRGRQPNLELPGSNAYYSKCLSLPIHPGMELLDVERVVRSVVEAVV